MASWAGRLPGIIMSKWSPRTVENIYCMCMISISLLAFLYAHNYASFHFPVPWPDEADLVTRAVNVQRYNRLYTPQLDQQHSQFYMPPGYMIITGLLFKMFGFSMSTTRFLSFLWMIIAFLLLMAILRDYKLRNVALLFGCLFLLGRPFVIAANIGRPEAMLLLFVTLGLLLLQRGEAYKGLAVLVLSPLIHPNGLFFLMAAFVWWVASRRGQRKKFDRWDLAAILVTVFIWLLYLVFIGRNLEDFLKDMAVQLSPHHYTPVINPFLKSGNLLLGLVIASCGLYCIFYKMKESLLMTLIIPSFLIPRLRREGWYDVFDALFYLCFTCLLVLILAHLIDTLQKHQMKPVLKGILLVTALHWLIPKLRIDGWYALFDTIFNVVFTCLLVLILAHLIDSLQTLELKPIRHWILTAAVLYLLSWNFKVGMIEGPMRYPRDMVGGDMRAYAPYPYIQPGDIQQIKDFLRANKKEGDLVTVRFWPTADGLFFKDLDDKSIRIVVPPFRGGELPADIYILHVSRYFPDYWTRDGNVKAAFAKARISPSDSKAILMQRNQTEIWYYNVVSREARETQTSKF